MAKFEMQLPTEIMKDIQKIHDNADDIFGGMTKAGAEVVLGNMRAGVPSSFHGSEIMKCLKMTRTYKMPSIHGVATKVGFYGYFNNKKGQRVPAPLVVNVYEYGRSDKPFKKHPFVRKAFKKGEIEQAMLKAQKTLSGGLLE